MAEKQLEKHPYDMKKLYVTVTLCILKKNYDQIICHDVFIGLGSGL